MSKLLLREVTSRSKILIFEESRVVGITIIGYKRAACRRESYDYQHKKGRHHQHRSLSKACSFDRHNQSW